MYRILILLVIAGSMAEQLFAQEPVPVALSVPAQSMGIDEFRLSGSVVAVKRSNLSARVDGAVASVMVDAGARVKGGDVLLELDASLEQHELQRLNANLEAARANASENRRLVNEAERLIRDNNLPQNELALRKAALASSLALLDAAKAEVSAQQQRLQWHQIKAPFDGVVSRKLTEMGEWVTRGTPVLELVATEDVYLEVQVPQERYAQLDERTEMTILPDADPQRTIPAQIAAKVPVADALTRTFLLRLTAKGSNAQLLPGASATALFAQQQKDTKVFTVPRDALLRNPDGSFSLFTVVEKGDQLVAQRRQVVLGKRFGDQVEIKSGLEQGERVVVRGNEILRSNQPVKVVDDS